MAKKKKEEDTFSDVLYTFEITYNNNKKDIKRTTAETSEDAELQIRRAYPNILSTKLLGWSQMKLRNINNNVAV